MLSSPLILNHCCYGNGHPLIILHGLFGSKANWSFVSRQLARRSTVFALDLRNHGNSPHGQAFDYSVLVEDLRCFMVLQQLKKATILGHSLGGKIAMAFGDSFPEMVEKLIVVDIAPKPYPAVHKHMIKAMISLDLNRVRSLNDAVEALGPSIPSLSIRKFLVKNLVRGGDGMYQWKINLTAIDQYYNDLSQGPQIDKTFNKPTLFIRGEDSNYIVPEDTALIREKNSNFKIVCIEGAGHWLHIDAPGKTVKVISDFLDRR